MFIPVILKLFDRKVPDSKKSYQMQFFVKLLMKDSKFICMVVQIIFLNKKKRKRVICVDVNQSYS